MFKSTSKLLRTLGIHSTILGSRYLHDLMEICLENEDHLLNLSRLYDLVAEKHGTRGDNVEHCIQTAVKNCWNNGNRELFITLAGYPVKGKPTNSEFIDVLYHYLKSSEN